MPDDYKEAKPPTQPFSIWNIGQYKPPDIKGITVSPPIQKEPVPLPRPETQMRPLPPLNKKVD